MQITTSQPSDTEAVMTVSAAAEELMPIKETVLKKLQPQLNLAGFRKGKAPLPLVEKNLDQAMLQTEFLEEAVSTLYADAIRKEKLRPVDRPEIQISKFVPFTELEFKATLPVVGNIKLPDYKKIMKEKPEVKITAKDVDQVLNSLQKQLAEKKDVDRAAEDGDQAWIDFVGVDDKGEPIKGADGKDYPLALGSNTFIPGFEENIVGLKPGDEKTFTLTFPKDYGMKALANKKVTFTVNVTKVQEVIEPKLDDEFAKKVGPFESIKQLKEDIKKQLQHEKQHEADRKFESELISEIGEKTKVSVPQVLVDEQIEALIRELRQNLTYRGQTWQEYLEAEGKTEEEYRKEELTPQAEKRVKASLALAEIAEAEGIDVSVEELEIRIQILKNQYQDNSMRAELDKPENRRDIASRLLTEKTVAKLVSYVTKK